MNKITVQTGERKRTWMIAVMWAALVVSVVVFFVGAFQKTISDQDEGYQALNCMDYGQSPIAMLSFYIGNIAIRLFGDGIYVLRLLSHLMYLLTIAFPLIYFYRRTGNGLWAIGMAVYLINYIEPSFLLSFYTWDSAAYPFESALMVCLLTYTDRPARVKALLSGVLCASLTLARIPAGVTLPVMVLTIYLSWPRGSRRGSFRDVGISLVAFVATALTLILIMKGSVSAYIDVWKPENIITGHTGWDNLWHSIKSARLNLTRWINETVFYAQIVVLVILAFIYRKVWGTGGWRFAVVLTTVFYIAIRFDWHGQVTVGDLFLTELTYVMLLVISISAGGLARGDTLKVLLITAFMLVPVVGSDQLLVRFGFIYTIPAMVFMVYRYKSAMLNVAIALSMLFTIAPVICYDTFNSVKKLVNPNWVHADVPHHQYLYDKPENWAEVQQEGDAAAELRRRGLKYAFFGDQRYLYEYTFNADWVAHLQWFHYYDDEQVAQWVRAYTREMDAVFVENPESEFRKVEKADSLFRANGFVPVKRLKNFTLYISENDSATFKNLQ